MDNLIPNARNLINIKNNIETSLNNGLMPTHNLKYNEKLLININHLIKLIIT